MRTERQKIKNVRIHQTPLPASPSVVNVRKRHTRKRGFSREKECRRLLPPRQTKDELLLETPCPAPRPGSPGPTAAHSAVPSKAVAFGLELMKDTQKQDPHVSNVLAELDILSQGIYAPSSDLPQDQCFLQRGDVPIAVGSSVGFSTASTVPVVVSDPGALPRAYDPDIVLSTLSLPGWTPPYFLRSELLLLGIHR